MKKRGLFVTLLLVVTMLITACGSTNPFEGKWKGTCDLTKYIQETLVESDSTFEEYVDCFEDLSFVINFTFEDDEIKMSVDKDSAEQFVENVEKGMKKMLKEYYEDLLAETYGGSITLEYLATVSGYESADAYLDAVVETMEFSSVADELMEALELEGTYEYDDKDTLTVTYEDDTEEEMKYEFKGDKLIITVFDEDVEFDIECEKQ